MNLEENDEELKRRIIMELGCGPPALVGASDYSHVYSPKASAPSHSEIDTDDIQMRILTEFGYGPPELVVKQPEFQPPESDESPPDEISNYTSGLERLEELEELYIKKRSYFGRNNAYIIKNNADRTIFHATEEDSGWFHFNGREVDVKLYDNRNNEVMQLFKPGGCFTCCLDDMVVSTSPGHAIGFVYYEISLIGSASFTIMDANHKNIFQIAVPRGFIRLFGRDSKFKVLTLSGVQVGKITKIWSAPFSVGNFRITFSPSINLHPKGKALILAACILIDIMVFEGRRF